MEWNSGNFTHTKIHHKSPKKTLLTIGVARDGFQVKLKTVRKYEVTLNSWERGKMEGMEIPSRGKSVIKSREKHESAMLETIDSSKGKPFSHWCQVLASVSNVLEFGN